MRLSPGPSLLLPLLCGLAALTGACGSPDDDGTLRVGVILPMTGTTATYGQESWNGLLLAEEDLRAAEGGPGVPFKLIQRDDKSEKPTAGSQAKNLIAGQKVHVILGSVASSNTLQIFKECRESGVPAITPASTNDDLIKPGDVWVSRICFKDEFQGREVLARFAWEQGYRKVAMVVDRGQDYSMGLADNFQSGFEARGGTVGRHFFVTEDADFSNVIQNVANDRPDAAFISGYYEQAGPMIKQAKGRWDFPVFGGDGMDSPELAGLVGDTDIPVFLSSHFAADAPDPRVQAFARRYKERFGKSPGAMAALGYDVLFVLMDAVRRCEDPFDREKLARAILETKDVQGITGRIDLTGEDRTPTKDAVILRLEGALRYVTTIEAGR